MGEIINLNKARKAKARTEAKTKAKENRRLFGRTSAQVRADALEKQRSQSNLDGKKREE